MTMNKLTAKKLVLIVSMGALVATSFAFAESMNSTTSVTTSLPPVFVIKPSLSIGENGRFLAHGLKVTSVATDSFQGQVWGVTYTINWSGNTSSEFLLRYGRPTTATSTIGNQLKVGDEVGVAGMVTEASPLVVDANVVRDYSLITPRPFQNDERGDNNNGEKGTGVSGDVNTNISIGADAQIRLNELLKKLQSLQELFKGRPSVSGGASVNTNTNVGVGENQ